MIGTDQVMNGVWVASVLLLLGLVPGLYQSLVDGLHNISTVAAVRTSIPHIPLKRQIEQPYWFAAVGMVVLLITCAAYFG